MSRGWLCNPASRISIMNGVHCQISATSTETRGAVLMMSGCGALAEPNRPHTELSVPLMSPYSGLNRACFHSSAAATGTMRNGVIIMVRTAPRPTNFRSSSSAMTRPSTRLTITTVTVSATVVTSASRVVTSESTRRKLTTPANPRSSG